MHYLQLRVLQSGKDLLEMLRPLCRSKRLNSLYIYKFVCRVPISSNNSTNTTGDNTGNLPSNSTNATNSTTASNKLL